jgi:hypothetical protein
LLFLTLTSKSSPLNCVVITKILLQEGSGVLVGVIDGVGVFEGVGVYVLVGVLEGVGV